MASFAVNADLLKIRSNAQFPFISLGDYEGTFLQSVIRVNQLEGKADDCKKVCNNMFI